MAWKDLSVAQRSQLMDIYRRNGIASLSEMRRLYDTQSLQSPLVEATSFATGGPKRIYPEYEEDSPEFIGPRIPESLYAGPPTPPGFGEAPIDWDKVRSKQRYMESTYNDRTYNKGSQAKGAFQITPVVLQEYTARTGRTGDLYDPGFNGDVRDWYMEERLPEFKAMKRGHPSDSIRAGIALASFNAGPGKVNEAITKAQAAGIDTDRSFGWLDYLKPETQDYVNFGLRNKDIPGTSKTQEKYQRVLDSLGVEYAKGGNLFGPGGNILPAYPEIIRNAIKKKYLTDYVNYGRVHGYPTQAEPKSYLKQFSWAEYLTSPYSLQKDKSEVPAIMARRALLAKYTGTEKGLRFNVDDYVEESPYRPSNAKDPNAKYYRMKDVGYEDRRGLFDSVAGQYKIGHGIDEDGRKYVSYYDIWDLAPFSLNSGENGNDIPGTTPIELYDRFYEDEDPDYYYRVIPEERPEERNVTFVKLNNLVNDNRSGGKIHIKKKNRGKFTALKKRTGKSASWFKAHGTPAQKKMAVFALNARKWKHAHGGIIF